MITAMNLYRRRAVQASLVLLAVLAGSMVYTASAQRRKPHKLRATALVELTTSSTGTTTARLVPITILDGGSFHDASIYKNTPQPMALDGGVVYEAQKTGLTAGFVTVGNATRDKNGNWAALGRWQPATPKVKPKEQFSASELNGPRDNDSGYVEGRPVLHRSPGSSGGSADGGSAPSSSPSGDGRPVLRRPSSDTPTESSPTPTPSTTPAPGDDRPVLHRPSGEAPAQSTPSPASTPSASSAPSPASTPGPAETPQAQTPDDPDRPTLRHRTPQQAHEEASAPPKPSPAAPQQRNAPASGAPQSTAPSTPVAPGTQTMVAVSDDQAIEVRSYEFVWKEGERATLESKMRRLALAQVSGNDTSSALGDSALTNVVIRGFDLDLSNEPVLVLTAEIRPGAVTPAKPAAKPGTKTGAATKTPPAAPAPTTQATRYVTVIARVDFDGNPQKLAASVTDSSRLDVAPRLELIDAVDVDGDGLAELLFRQYSFDEKSFVIYSIGRSTVTKLFEGASQPLK